MNDNTVNPPDAGQVIDQIDRECQFIKERSLQAGWTPWALLGAIAGLTWLALSEYATGSIRGANIAALFFAMLCAFDASFFVYRLITLRCPRVKGPRRYASGGEIFNKGGRLTFYYLLVRSIFVLLLLHRYSASGTTVEVLFYSLQYVYAGISLLLLAMPYLTVRFDIHVEAPNSERDLQFTLCSISLIGINLYCAHGFYLIQTTVGGALGVSQIKFSGTCVALLCLAGVLTKDFLPPPLLESLFSLRRDIALGRIAVTDAIKQLDIILAGLRAIDIVQSDLGELLDIRSRFHNDVIQQFARAQFANKTAKDKTESIAKGVKPTPDDIILFNTLATALSLKSKELEDAYASFSKKWVATARKVNRLLNENEELKAIEKSLEERLNETIRYHLTVRQSANEAITACNAINSGVNPSNTTHAVLSEPR